MLKVQDDETLYDPSSSLFRCGQKYLIEDGTVNIFKLAGANIMRAHIAAAVNRCCSTQNQPKPIVLLSLR